MLVFLGFEVFVSVVIAWFAVIFTGRYPRSLFTFAVDVERWSLRVLAYSVAFVTGQYPPFRLGE